MSMSTKNIFYAFYGVFLSDQKCIFEILWNKTLKHAKYEKNL
jgi:hypothetical protein